MKRETLFSKLFSKLPVKLPGAERDQGSGKSKYGISELKLAFFICDWNRANIISDVFAEKKIGFHFIIKASGTASSEILDLLGLGAGDKAVVTCLEKPGMAPVLLKEVRERLGSRGPGVGIAFTIPLSGINSPILRVFRQPPEEAGAAPQEDTFGNPPGNYGRFNSGNDRRNPQWSSHSMILSVINRDYTDELMNAARKAGATGGTVINARSQTRGGGVKYFDIFVQEERELVIILAGRGKKDAIMQEINEVCGITSKAQGIVVSLPVDSVMSLGFDQTSNF